MVTIATKDRLLILNVYWSKDDQVPDELTRCVVCVNVSF